MSVGELDGLTGFEEGFGGDNGPFWIKLGFLVAEDLLSIDAVNDFFVPSDFDLDFDPLIGREVGGAGLDNVLGDELAVDFEVGSGGADIAGGAFAFSFVGEELELEADGEALVEGHGLRGLGVNHDAAVEVHVAGSIGHYFSDELIFETEEVVGVGEVGEEMAEFFVELRVFVILAFEDAVFDSEGVEGVFAERMFRDFGSPAGEVLSVEEGNPLGCLGGEEEGDEREDFANHEREDDISL